MSSTRIAVVTAGLSVPSSTRLLADRLASAVARRVPGAEPEVTVVELRDLAVPIAHQFATGFPGPALAEAQRAVADADALIAVTPVFTASYSGLLKSFFDVLDRDALRGKPVLIGATGGTPRHSLVLDHAMRPLFTFLHAAVVPTGVFAASEDWGADGLDERIDRAAAELVALLKVDTTPVTAPDGTSPAPAADTADTETGSRAAADAAGAGGAASGTGSARGAGSGQGAGAAVHAGSAAEGESAEPAEDIPAPRPGEKPVRDKDALEIVPFAQMLSALAP